MILILGGARSGKSRFANELAKKQCRRVAYIATAPMCDKEMKQRVRLHKRSRPRTWVTVEAQSNPLPQLKKLPKTCDGAIFECIATYVSNLMFEDYSDPQIINNAAAVLKTLTAAKKKVFIVSNEVGGGVVPDTETGRRFRDIVGSINQLISKKADEVYLVVAGLPLRIK
ncbi:MAG: bifunctional adenosylcobinamide kinase/adenosylcobinamide-phosphate guanylyltransferase [Candidatus Omnitrophica bacterium]|nr:bifunctional adenosylcobinamide kinase/adenosylcobinamide-phosphate guanylyltransferase [Candidatus Omnitrophota bacterium]